MSEMVTEEMELNKFVTALQEKTERAANYKSVLGFLQDSDSDQAGVFLEDIAGALTRVLSHVCTDVSGSNVELAQLALHFLGTLLYQEQVCRQLSPEQEEEVLTTLCKVIKETKDRSTCTRALWCIRKQRLSAAALAKQVEDLLAALEEGQCKKNFKSITVELEALNANISLLESIPNAMKEHAGRWARLIYPLLSHGASAVRERTTVAMELGMPLVTSQQEEVAMGLAADLKALLVRSTTELYESGHEVAALSAWVYYVRLLGKTLHHGSLINQLLPLVEKGFKNSSHAIKAACYRCWAALIDNFALNLDILADARRQKLIMQVFRLSQAKSESVAQAKLQAWWHLVVKLGDRAPALFDQVCVPLLSFCVSGSVKPAVSTPSRGALASPGTPRVSPALSLSGTGATYRSVQLACLQILAQLLRQPSSPDNTAYVYTIEPLQCDVIQGATCFLKHHHTFLSAITHLFLSIGTDIPESLVLAVWSGLAAHMRGALEHTSKKDHTDCFSRFLTSLKQVADSQCFPPPLILSLLDMVSGLPEKALSSLSYQIGGASVLTQSSPALYIIRVLFTNRLLETCMSRPQFSAVFARLLGCGLAVHMAALGFCQSVLTLLSERATDAEHPDALYTVWSALAGQLHDHIKKTNEVNQGGALEYDFSCVVGVLTFPLLHLLTPPLKQTNSKALLKQWSELYGTVCRLAAMVTSTPPNSACDVLCQRLLQARLCLSEAEALGVMVQVCDVMVKHLEFSSLGGASNFNIIGAPTVGGQKERGLGRLSGVCTLLTSLVRAVNDHAKQQGCSLTSQCVLGIITSVSTLFTHIPSPAVLVALTDKMAPDLATFIGGGVTKAISNKTFSTQFYQKIDKLWIDITTSVQACYKGPYDSDFLATMSPLLATAFLHSRRSMKKQTLMLWSNTFAKSGPLTYPEELKAVLRTIKEKSALVLPGWVVSDTEGIVGETPVSQMTQGGESQVPPPEIVVMASSPGKGFGSFLNKKPVSPHVKSSPLQAVTSPTRSPKTTPSAKKKLSLRMIDDMSSSAFVKITSPPKRNRVLTEHQKDVMREKRDVIPALYSAADVTQDNSVMARFCTDTQDGSCSNLTPTPSEDIKITPLLFEKSKPKPDENATPSKIVAAATDKKTKAGGSTAKKRQSTGKQNKLAVTTRRRSVRFSDEIDLETLPETLPEAIVSSDSPDVEMIDEPDTNAKTNQSIRYINTVKSTSVADKEKNNSAKMNSVKCENTANDDDSVMIIDDSVDDSETQNVTPIREVDANDTIPDDKVATFVETIDTAPDTANDTSMNVNDVNETNVDTKKASSVSESTSAIASKHLLNVSDNTLRSDTLDNSNPKQEDKLHKDAKKSTAETDNDNILPNSQQESVPFSDYKSSMNSTELQESESETSTKSGLSSFLKRFSPAKQSPSSKRRTRSQSPSITSPLKKSPSLTSPRKRTPTQKRSQSENGSALQKWLVNSQQSAFEEEKKNSTVAVEGVATAGKPANQEKEKDEKGDYSLLGADVSPVPKEKATAPVVVMAEDTQQYSPKPKLLSPSNELHVVKETPVKEQTEASEGVLSKALKNLDSAMDTVVCVGETEVIPDSQVSPKQPLTINVSPGMLGLPKAGTGLAVGPKADSGGGSWPKDVFHSGQVSPALSTSSLASSVDSVTAVVKLRKLTPEEIVHWSPKRGRRQKADGKEERDIKSKRGVKVLNLSDTNLMSSAVEVDTEVVKVDTQNSQSSVDSTIPERPFQLFASPLPVSNETNTEMSQNSDFIEGTQPFDAKTNEKTTHEKPSVSDLVEKDDANKLSESVQEKDKTDREKLKEALAESTLTSQMQASPVRSDSAMNTQESSQNSESDLSEIPSGGSTKRRRGGKKRSRDGNDASLESSESCVEDSVRAVKRGRRSLTGRAGVYDRHVLKAALAQSTQSGSETSQDEAVTSHRGRRRSRGRPRKLTSDAVSGSQGNDIQSDSKRSDSIRSDATKVQVIDLSSTISDSESELVKSQSRDNQSNKINGDAQRTEVETLEENVEASRKDSEQRVKDAKQDREYDLKSKLGLEQDKSGTRGKVSAKTIKKLSSESEDDIPLSRLIPSVGDETRKMKTTEINNTEQTGVNEKDDTTEEDKEKDRDSTLKDQTSGEVKGKEESECTQLQDSFDSQDSECIPFTVSKGRSITAKEDSEEPKAQDELAKESSSKNIAVSSDDEDVPLTELFITKKPSKDVCIESAKDRKDAQKKKRQSRKKSSKQINELDSIIDTAFSQACVESMDTDKCEHIQEENEKELESENRSEKPPEQFSESTQYEKITKRRRKKSPDQVLRKRLSISMKTSPRRRTRSVGTPVRSAPKRHGISGATSGSRLKLKKQTTGGRSETAALAEKQMDYILSESIEPGEEMQQMGALTYEASEATQSQENEVTPSKDHVGTQSNGEAAAMSRSGDTHMPMDVATKSKDAKALEPIDGVQIDSLQQELSTVPDSQPQFDGQQLSNTDDETQGNSEKSQNLGALRLSASENSQEATALPAVTKSKESLKDDGGTLSGDTTKTDETITSGDTEACKESDWNEDPLAFKTTTTSIAACDTPKDEPEKVFKSPLKVDVVGKEGEERVSSMDALNGPARMSSPLRAGKAMEQPETPTSSMQKELTMSRSFRMLQQSMSRQSPSLMAPGRMPGVSSEPRRPAAHSRRPILKSSPLNLSPVKALAPACCPGGARDSPPAQFRAVTVSRLYSPRASPSAGILKRRRLTEQVVDSPSPPNKQRRVSFSDNVQMKVFENPRAARLVGRASSPRPRPARCLNMPHKSPLTQESEGTPSSEGSPATQSQLNCSDAVFPALLDCAASIDVLLPQLTSSTWSRGLGQLMRSKGVETVGELCALTEYDVQQLPIRTPKLTTLKNALSKYAQRTAKASGKVASELAEVLDSSIESERGSETGGDLLDEIKRLVDEPGASSTANRETSHEEMTEDVEDMNKTNDLPKPTFNMNNMSASDMSDINSNQSKAAHEGLVVKPSTRRLIMEQLQGARSRMEGEEFREISTSGLIGIQGVLNELMSKVNIAMSAKCPMSPSSSQSDD